jgi:hypothetical protein
MNKKALVYPREYVERVRGEQIFASGITASAMHQLRQTGTESGAKVNESASAVQLFARSLKICMQEALYLDRQTQKRSWCRANQFPFRL